MQSTFSQRFGELLSYFKLTSSEVARLTDLKRQTVDNLLKKGNPEYSSLAPLLRYFHNVSARWLLLGEGTMFLPNPESQSLYFNDPGAEYHTADKESVQKFWMEDRKELNRVREINHSLMDELSKLREQNHSFMDELSKLRELNHSLNEQLNNHSQKKSDRIRPQA